MGRILQKAGFFICDSNLDMNDGGNRAMRAKEGEFYAIDVHNRELKLSGKSPQ
jgi:hypothetical protein